MSHQLVGKKWQFEIPPLDWKAPETNKEADIKTVAADADAAEDQDA
ncbi:MULTISPECIES: hypothetical protein [Achromobacter]|jgi:hypothetical protein|uniref:Uncharacterized protein n=1 Tax=Achromobacter aegrifaciens TaxID=1287736 RepID=A0AAD2IZZ8_ACHAE|nr:MULTISPECIES: hypothetical protein [Achromobacter]MBD9418601.1 hypothetical protein [Achromobacter sp. ACM04]MBD9428987.1 hypothetical protein [Achromobacter sp. ACM03]MBD9473680.1 hypothetical protein [Achromobacter sp. ACM01]MDQ1760327.1 hypothetical protein [Achromobacter aegrifaciens]MDR7945661.1 hypothetical protein [Achromobacter aegrifaciens]